MVGLLAFLLSLAAFAGTVAGVNAWFAPGGVEIASEVTQWNYDIFSAAKSLSMTASSMASMPAEAAWAIGIFVLILPAIIVFLMVNGAFSGRG